MGAVARGLFPASVVDTAGRTRFERVALLVVVLTAALAYANALGNGFVLDDGAVVRANPLVTSPGNAWRAFGLPYWPEQFGAGQYRPLGVASFALDWAVSDGSPAWFHGVNVLWHVAATAAVWMVALELLAPAGALVAALLFAVHPVHVEAVANIVGRLECMAAVFVLGALLAHRRSHWSAPLWLAFGLLSKESAIVFIGLALAHDVMVTPDWRTALKASRWRYAGYALVTIIYAVTLAAVFRDRAMAIQAPVLNGAHSSERLLLVAQVVPHYVRLLVAPLELSASYAPNVITPGGVLSTGTLLGVGILVAFATLIVIAVRGRRWPVMAFALLWIPIALAPVSNVLFASGVVLAERTLYLPSVGFCLAAGAAAERLTLTRPRVVSGGIAAVFIAFTARTWTRTPVWRDDRTYLLQLLSDHPESYEAHLTAGRVLKGADQLEPADRELTIARKLFARDPLVYREAADLALRQQRPSLAAALLDSARLAPTLTMKRP